MEITLPSRENGQHFSKHFGARWFEPRVINFDQESLIVHVAGAEPDPEKSSTTIIEKHENSGYGLAVVDFGKSDVIKFEQPRGSDSMENCYSA